MDRIVAVQGYAASESSAADERADVEEEEEVIAVGNADDENGVSLPLPPVPGSIRADVDRCRSNTRADRSAAVATWLYLERLHQLAPKCGL